MPLVRPTILLALALLTTASAARADTRELPDLHAGHARSLVVDGRRGSDHNPGSAARPLRTVTAAWARIPTGRLLERPVRIVVRAGRYSATALPNYWERRWGTRHAPVLIVAAPHARVSFASVNLYDLRWVAFDGIDFTDRFDLFHCERCQHVLLTRSRLVGSPQDLHENVKVNQSQHVAITHSYVSGADDNAIDFVAVQHARIADNVIERANDWCAYAKGGSAFVTVVRNRIRRCGTGGFTAGQGTGFQFMIAPFIRYEAYGIEVVRNVISRTLGAGVGINGGFNVLVAGNRMWDVGRRSHSVEVVYGSRSCDGTPGDEGRERCAGNLDAGGWGTTRVDDGTNYVRIPNRHVWILGNTIDQPRRQGDQLFSIAEPFSGSEQDGSGLGAVRADDDLHLAGNLIAGRGLPTGVDGCTASDCRAFAQRNSIAVSPGLFRDPTRGDLRLRRGVRAPRWATPEMRWTDSGGVRP